ncbi:Putative bifunctional phosphatase/peptidyl-prolyl cis-trans isomerase [Paraliobacillus sp. PM-2]|uniref:Cof-type HAD-IIB family hydrolase n=1 Tax=Paraliobacillus sp. PM-2 TaxID=1462524 RepID=UPI00061BA84B|nr:Cof-type HAD-IIB family hydrolase [Paraliobacillus sp. PM-2]CQR47896.1 Putative bifunctional phosphatase/peptidyl-prolyl cis-trans isomerase [Paraliobacillus sp. PM-2]
MNEQNVIFFDIDGTLLDHDKNLPNNTRKAIQQLQDKGNIVAIATGRAPFMYETLREELNINTFVSFNGQYVVVNGEVIYKNPLELSSLMELTELGLKHNHPIVYMDHEDMKANVPEHDYINQSIATLKIKQFPTHDPYYYQDREILQSLFFCSEGEEAFYQQQFPSFDFIRWHPVSVDILPKGGSKANGINKAIEALGISKENTYAFGDGLNDLEMLSTVTNSVAMGNAKDEVKNAAKYVTKDVDKNGIEHGLKMVGLL